MVRIRSARHLFSPLLSSPSSFPTCSGHGNLFLHHAVLFDPTVLQHGGAAAILVAPPSPQNGDVAQMVVHPAQESSFEGRGIISVRVRSLPLPSSTEDVP